MEPKSNRRALRWFASELLVVVTGVLIALALGSVYQIHLDRKREAQYVGQLIADLQETEQLMASVDSANRVWDRGISSLIRSFRGGPAPDRDSALAWINDIQLDDPAPVLGTADAIIQTGDLQLMRDPQLRSAITAYVSRSRDYNVAWLLQMETEFTQARTAFRERIDFLEADQRDVSKAGSSNPLFDIGSRSPYPLDVNQLLHDRAAYSSLTRIVLAKRQLADARRWIREDAEKLRKRLQASSDAD